MTGRTETYLDVVLPRWVKSKLIVKCGYPIDLTHLDLHVFGNYL